MISKPALGGALRSNSHQHIPIIFVHRTTLLHSEDDYERVPGAAALGRRLAARLPQARAGVVDTTLPPFVVPTVPARSYFLFQQVRL